MKKKELYKVNTLKLWNSYSYVKKYDNFKYTKQDGNTYYLNERCKGVLNYLDNLNLGKQISILELGYGAGQNAKYFIKRCKKFKNSWWINSWLFNYGWNDKWKFETNRRLLSYSRLKNILKKNQFLIKKSISLPFFYNNKNILTKLILSIFDKLLMLLNKIFIFSFFLRYIGATNIFLCKKNKF